MKDLFENKLNLLKQKYYAKKSLIFFIFLSHLDVFIFSN